MAKIGPYEIVVLIDSGLTHNFSSTRLANFLQLLIMPTTAFSVQVTNGEKLSRQGQSEKVQIVIQNIDFSLTVYLLPITSLDMVLGIQWLEMVGFIVCNWKSLTMISIEKIIGDICKGSVHSHCKRLPCKKLPKKFGGAMGLF